MKPRRETVIVKTLRSLANPSGGFRSCTGTSARSERGQSLLEFAVGMIVLLVLLAGIMDAGRALFTYMALRDSAQEGALYGSYRPDDTTGIEDRVRNASNFLRDLSDDPDAVTDVSITISGGACTGGSIAVQVDYDNYPITMPFLGAILGSQSIPISAEIIDTILRPPCE